MTQQTTFRPELPSRLKDLQQILIKCQHKMEVGRMNDLYAFAWYEEKKAYSVEASRTVNTSESIDRGVVLRIMYDGVHYETACNALDEETLLNNAMALRTKIDNLNPRYTEKAHLPTTWQQEISKGLPDAIRQHIPKHATEKTIVHFAPDCQQDPDAVNITDLLSRAKTYRDKALTIANEESPALADSSEIADIQISARFRTIYNLFVDREKIMSQILPMSIIAAGGTTTTGQSNRAVKGGLGTLELIELTDSDLNDIAKVPRELSKAEKLKPGKYKVITGPALSGIIAHEAFGHTQEGDTWMKDRSIAKGLQAEQVRVGNDLASIVNNPAVYSMEGQNAGCNGSYYFDNEGQLARPQTILDKGYLSTPMTDLTSASELNVPRTANGKRESWRRPLMARQTNTYFTPGDKSLPELIAMVDDGFMAIAPHGGMEDPKGGSLTAGAGYFEEIKNGQLTGKKVIGPAGGHIELTDSVFDVLNNIEAKTSVSHADEIPNVKLGGCGKYHKELVDAGVGGPYILWQSINCG